MIARNLCCLLIYLVPALALGQSAWVSDEFEITVRTGPSTSNAIQLMLIQLHAGPTTNQQRTIESHVGDYLSS